MDIQKEREAFEQALVNQKNVSINNLHVCTIFDAEKNKYSPSDVCDPKEDFIVDWINSSWSIWQAAKAQAVPERTNQTFEDWLSDSENTKVYFGGYRERANEFAHQAWMASFKAKLPKDKILMPRSLDQKHIDYVVHQLAISSGASLISEVYECLIEAQEPAND